MFSPKRQPRTTRSPAPKRRERPHLGEGYILGRVRLRDATCGRGKQQTARSPPTWCSVCSYRRRSGVAVKWPFVRYGARAWAQPQATRGRTNRCVVCGRPVQSAGAGCPLASDLRDTAPARRMHRCRYLMFMKQLTGLQCIWLNLVELLGRQLPWVVWRVVVQCCIYECFCGSVTELAPNYLRLDHPRIESAHRLT